MQVDWFCAVLFHNIILHHMQGQILLLYAPGSTHCTVCAPEMLFTAYVCCLIYFYLCNSAMTLSTPNQLFRLLWVLSEETNSFFSLEYFYCIPTWADKNESDIRAPATAVLTWTYFCYFYQSHETCQFIVFWTPSTGPVGRIRKRQIVILARSRNQEQVLSVDVKRHKPVC